MTEPAQPTIPTPPASIGKYQIRGVLGRGGMGVVYAGFDPSIQRQVAIKTVSRAALDESAPLMLERFRREAQAAGKLVHPCIVQVHEYLEDEAYACIVMELVSGRSLFQRQQEQRRFRLPQVAAIVDQLLMALEFAHRHGVIHQDIKPSNILISTDGRVKVGDFGIAQIGTGTSLPTTDRFGTPHYMAPEQFLGQPSAPATDVYSAGVVAYELLLGQRPFSGTTAFVMRQVVDLDTRPTPPSQLDPRIAPELETAILTALAKRPQERFQSAAEFRNAFLNGVEVALRSGGYAHANEPITQEISRNLMGAAQVLRGLQGGAGDGPALTAPPRPAATSSARKPRLLVVDDEERILTALKALFRHDYHVFATSDPSHALRFIEKFHMHAIVSDQRMPVMQGNELLRRSKDISPTSMRLLLTGYSDLAAIVGSINEGEIFRFISKPWNNRELRQIVQQAVDIGLSIGEARVSRSLPTDGGEQLLVVDSGYEVLSAVRDLVGSRCVLRHAFAVHEALDLLDRHDIAVLVVNVETAPAECVALLKLLKQEKPQLLAIAVTSTSDSELMIELINQAQVFRFLNKPLNPQLVRQHVLAALERHHAFRQSPELLRTQQAESSAVTRASLAG